MELTKEGRTEWINTRDTRQTDPRRKSRDPNGLRHPIFTRRPGDLADGAAAAEGSGKPRESGLRFCDLHLEGH